MKKPRDFIYIGLLIILIAVVVLLAWPRKAAAQESIPPESPQEPQSIQQAKPPRPLGRGEQLLKEAEAKRKAQSAAARANRAERLAKAKEKGEARTARAKQTQQ